MRLSTQIYTAVTAELDALGIPHRLHHGAKHDAVVFDLAGKTHRVVISRTPSDRRTLANAMALLRRLLRLRPGPPVMRRRLLASALMLLPAVALADPPQVPAIQTAAASASASATITAPAPTALPGAVPATGLPPPIKPLSPSAPLNAKEKASAVAAAAWRNHNDKAVRGEDGVLRWPFGASLPSVVCSPLQVCDVALEANEVVSSIHLGDKIRWSVMPAVSGVGADRTTHLICKPSDAGLSTSILVFTDKRIYSIKLVSTQAQWTPLTAFTYPETAQKAWENYGATMTTDTVTAASTSSIAPAGGQVDLNYTITGKAPWKPTGVYAQGGKTVVVFSSAMQYGTAPALLGLANDGGWFTSPSEQMLRYRIASDRYIIDGLPQHVILVEGVGGSQTRVDIVRGGSR